MNKFPIWILMLSKRLVVTCPNIMNVKSSVHFLNRDLSYYLFLYQRRICMKMDTEPAVMGIESSCDDTGAAIVYANGKISAEHLISQHNTVLR